MTRLKDILRRRLARQHLTSRRLPTAADAVHLLTCAQAQDAPLAAWSLGQRTGLSYAEVTAEQAAGAFVRTHILRPTWHLVAAADLRWVQSVTAPKVLAGMAARHRALALEGAALERLVDAVVGVLQESSSLTRPEVQDALERRGVPLAGERLAHVLAACELRALVCSGRPRQGRQRHSIEHTYALVDEVVTEGPADRPSREEGMARLLYRFIEGHGPVSAVDARRWCGVTLAEFDSATRALADAVTSVTVGGVTLWESTSVPPRATGRPRAMLLPAFDEAFLSYTQGTFPRLGTADRSRIFAQTGGGVVLVGLDDVGRWRRSVTTRGGGRVVVEVVPEGPLSSAQRADVAAACDAFGRFLSLPVDLEWMG